MISIGFTGTQKGMTNEQKIVLRFNLQVFKTCSLNEQPVFHHGDCIGADEEAARIAREMGFRIVGHLPLNWSKRAYFDNDEERDPLPYLDRNHNIIMNCDRLLAAPATFKDIQRSGTWSTIRKAIKLGKKNTIILPDGDVIINGEKNEHI